MKTIGYDCTVKVGIIFTMPEILNLMWLAEHHYDSRCRATSKPGGILHGIKNVAEWEIADKTKRTPWFLSFSDVDTLAKITEPVIDHEKNMIALHLELRGLLQGINEEHARHNSGRR